MPEARHGDQAMTANQQNEAIAKWMGRPVPCPGDQHHWKRFKIAEYLARISPNSWVEECTICRATRNNETRHPSQYYWDEEHRLPDYVNDLNAIHEAIAKLGDGQYEEFTVHLARASVGSADRGYDMRPLYEATASQRAEALLKTLSLWKEP